MASQLIGYQVYRQEQITINDEQFDVIFAKHQDDNMIRLLSHDRTKSHFYHFTDEVAVDGAAGGHNIEEEAYRNAVSDVERGLYSKRKGGNWVDQIPKV